MSKEEFLSFYDVGEITTDQLSNFVTSVDIREGAIYLNRLHTGEEFLDQLKAIGVIYNSNISLVDGSGVIEFSNGQSMPINLGVNTIDHDLTYSGFGLFDGMAEDGLTLKFKPFNVKAPLKLTDDSHISVESNLLTFGQYARMEYKVEDPFNWSNSNGDSDIPFTSIAVHRPFIKMAQQGFKLAPGKYYIEAITCTYLSKNADAYLRVGGVEIARSPYGHFNSGSANTGLLPITAEFEIEVESIVTFGVNGSGGNTGNKQKFGVGYYLNPSIDVNDNLFAWVDIWKVA